MARWLASDVWMNTTVNHGGSSMGKGMQAATIHDTGYCSVEVLQEKNGWNQKSLAFGRTHPYQVRRRLL